MKISVFTCVLNPDFWCFPYQEALKSYCDFADEVIVVDGGSNDGSTRKILRLSDKIVVTHLDWPWEYKQREFPRHLNYGFSQCTGDWVVKFDIDFVLHDFDALTFRRKLQEANDDRDIWVASFPRINLLNRFEGFEKDSLPWAIHKGVTHNQIKFGVETRKQNSDWSQTIRVQKIVEGTPYGDGNMGDHVLRLGNPIYNYDCFFRTKEKCISWFQRSARAYRNETGFPLYGETDDGAWRLWKSIRRKQRETYDKKVLKIEDHPIYIQEKIKSMTPDMWGHSNWDWKL